MKPCHTWSFCVQTIKSLISIYLGVHGMHCIITQQMNKPVLRCHTYFRCSWEGAYPPTHNPWHPGGWALFLEELGDRPACFEVTNHRHTLSCLNPTCWVSHIEQEKLCVISCERLRRLENPEAGQMFRPFQTAYHGVAWGQFLKLVSSEMCQQWVLGIV